ncbi:unnamed protein product [Paramecium sonneborni]|uniref:Uncharacterized protein n=1 Tax=Paramecium sonneborni TaxID=65129 RepID=A0A8S1QVJ9_9CILI|nr:unnamed protein product [Paramecium sonneborni]
MFQKVQKSNSQKNLKQRFFKDFQLVSELKDIKYSQNEKIIAYEGNGYENAILKSQSKIQIDDIIEFKLKIISISGSLKIVVGNTQKGSTYFTFYGPQHQILQQIYLWGGETLQFILDMTEQSIQVGLGNQTIQKKDLREEWFPQALINDPSSEYYLYIGFSGCCIEILDE